MIKIINNLKPDPDFEKSSKALFLDAYRQKFPQIHRKPSRVGYFAGGLASGMIIMAIIGGTATYADQSNVNPESALYPLKRIHESFELVISNNYKKPIVELKLAERRLNEIKEIKELNPENPILPSLINDFKKSVSNSSVILESENQMNINFTPTSSLPVTIIASSSPRMATTTSSVIKEDKKTDVFSIPSFRNNSEKSNDKNIKFPIEELKKEDWFKLCQSFNYIFNEELKEIKETLESNLNLRNKFEDKCSDIIKERNNLFNNQKINTDSDSRDKGREKVEDND